MCLDVIRALRREPSCAGALSDLIQRACELDPRMAKFGQTLLSMVASAEESDARRITEAIARVVQATLLLERAPDWLADAFVQTRIAGGSAGSSYGGRYARIPAIEQILDRAQPR